MSKYLASLVIALACISACKTSTNPVDGQKLRLITSDQDTTAVRAGPVNFTVTVLDNSGYGVAGAYVDFYDPIEHRSRHEGPTPFDGTLGFTDTVPITFVGTVEISFVAEHTGATTSDSLRLWIDAIDIRPWQIDTIEANSWYYGEIGVRWSRPPMDRGTDTVLVSTASGFTVSPILVQYPLNEAIAYVGSSGADTITVHNTYCSSLPIEWSAPYYLSRVDLYPVNDSFPGYSSGFYLAGGYLEDVNSNTDYLLDFLLVADPGNGGSGYSIISPSLSSLSGFSGGKVTKFYHPVLFIDSGAGLNELYYSNDLSHYVDGVPPMYKIPIPDSSQFSIAIIAVTSNGNFAQICINPLTHDWTGNLYAPLQVSYQQTPGLPYAGRARHK